MQSFGVIPRAAAISWNLSATKVGFKDSPYLQDRNSSRVGIHWWQTKACLSRLRQRETPTQGYSSQADGVSLVLTQTEQDSVRFSGEEGSLVSSMGADWSGRTNGIRAHYNPDNIQTVLQDPGVVL
ncbi:MAG: hypothetical protein KIT08_02425 [Anaerolineales bacterium]|nr:MAG: hypothetical protein KIT08_02425 [Anaerolineales bacterium]